MRDMKNAVRHLLFAVLAFSLLWNFCDSPLLAAADDSPGGKPNILFIFVDDLAFDCVGYFGNQEVKTPNIDSIARRGLNFGDSRRF